jgi:hypothetical protein
LCCIRDAAQRYNNPIEIVQDMSTKGAREFVRGIFGDEIVALFAPGFEEKVYEGAQLVQHAAFAHDWTPRKVTPKKNASSSTTGTVRGGDINMVMFNNIDGQPVAPRWTHNFADGIIQAVQVPPPVDNTDWEDILFNEEEA